MELGLNIPLACRGCARVLELVGHIARIEIDKEDIGNRAIGSEPDERARAAIERTSSSAELPSAEILSRSLRRSVAKSLDFMDAEQTEYRHDLTDLVEGCNGSISMSETRDNISYTITGICTSPLMPAGENVEPTIITRTEA